MRRTPRSDPPATALFDLPGPPGDAGLTHGSLIRDVLTHPRLDAYLRDMLAIKKIDADELARQSMRWLDTLPAPYREEIDGMSLGARVPTADVAAFLYADIAGPPGPGFGSVAALSPTDSILITGTQCPSPLAATELLPDDGPGCSAFTTRVAGVDWVARNCDWYRATLQRGTAAVVHRTPNRHAVMALGLLGDIDADTAVNDRQLWLHLHTLPAIDRPRADRSIISWLFWARSALEQCATLDELEAFIRETDRDRGVIVVALDGKSGQSAVFECTRAGYERHEPQPHDAGRLFATNHCRRQHPTQPRPFARPGSTITRLDRLRTITADHPPEHAPDDLIDMLADPHVEMRNAESLRTIYSAVCAPREKQIYFAAGGWPEDRPAASTGHWTKIAWPFS